MSEEILKSLYDWNPWIEGGFPKELSGFKRDYFLDPYLEVSEIKILEGPRRAGKSTLLYQIIEKILKHDKGVLYINFEDEILKGFSLGEIVSAYQQTAPINYLFIDEIQNCKAWVPYIRKSYDRKEIPQIWISGSNSSLIKNELATLLTGRNLTIHIYPLSFKEYLFFKSIEVAKLPFSPKKEALIKSSFKNYLEFGSFPAVTLRHVLQKELLINYFDDFIYKDIGSRYDVNPVKIRELGMFLASNSAKSFSYRGIASALGMHANTIVDYCSYFTEIFLFSELYKFDYSLKTQIGSEKKIYSIDTGLASAVSFRFSEDIGRMLENLVYNELRRRGEEIYFHKQNYECDFLIKKQLTVLNAVQVTLDLGVPEVKKREIRGLLEAMKVHRITRGMILTMDEEGYEEFSVENETLKIDIIPVWKWLLTVPEN